MTVHSPPVPADQTGPAPAARGSRPTRWLLLVGVPLAWGLLAALLVPRGPTSTAESLALIGGGLAVGFLAGRGSGTRWSVLVAPVAFVAAYEVGRLGVDGPTVDGIGWSEYGVVALLTGRVFTGLVAVLPMMWGAALGARRGRLPGTVALATTGVLLLGLTALVARPASTQPIPGPDGEPLPGSIAELTSLEVDGHDLGLMVRGHDVDNPVLLFLAGGPGGSELGAMRRHLPDLEQHFTVVTWDQRGTGRSYGELDPLDTLTLSNAVRDTIAVADHLRERFDQDRIYVVGQSWGTTLGVLAVQQAPERFAALVGVGQMVSQRATDEIFYDDKLAWAERTGRDELAAQLREAGPPPYDDPRDYELALSGELEIHPYDHSANSEGSGQMAENLFVREYSLTEQVRLLSGTLDTFAGLYPQLQDVDFRRTATELEVPVFLVQGAHEAPGRAELVDQWWPSLDAPVKDLTVFGTSGHRPLFEQPQEFVEHLTEVVLPRTEAWLDSAAP